MADSLEFNFTIPGKLAGANELKSADRAHWSVGAKLRKKDLRLAHAMVCAAKGLYVPRFPDAVGVSFTWIEPNAKRDPDNIIAAQKVILDALVLANIIHNDTQRYIKFLSHKFGKTDKDNPRIEVTVYGIPTSSSIKTPDRSLPGKGPDDQPSQAL